MGERKMDYTRITYGLNDRGVLLPKGQEYKFAKNKIKNSDVYTSLFYYTEAHNKIMNSTGSIAGISDVTTTKLAYDLDCADNVEKAREQAVELVNRLLKYFKPENIQIFFSGKKGFALVIDTNTRMTPREVKNICMNIAAGLDTLDVQIYNASRIFRLPLSRHKDTGLYKIPLNIEQLQDCTVEEIKELAKTTLEPSDIEGAWEVAEMPEELLKLKNETPKQEMLYQSFDMSVKEGINWEGRPKGLASTTWLLQEGYYEAGERTRALLILVARLKALGLDEIDTYYKLKASADKQSRRTGQERKSKKELWGLVEQVFSPTWSGGTFDDNQEPILMKLKDMIPENTSETNLRKDLVCIQEVSKLFHEFASNIKENRIHIGIKELDESLDMLIGRVYIFAGSPGSGKTSILFQMFENLCKQFVRSIFFTFDMSVQDCYQKIIQREFNLTAKQVYEEYAIPERREQFVKTITEKYGHIIFVNSSGMTVEMMKDRITQAEKQFGEIKVVAVDYMTLARSDKSDSNEHSKAVIQGLKSIAIDMRKCVISLNQPNKANQRINEPLSGYGGIQGSSAVQELANAILWIYRPGASASTFENDKYYSIECMKNRHGGLFSVDLAWNGVTGTVRSMTPVEKMKLEQFRQEQKEKKKEIKDDW